MSNFPAHIRMMIGHTKTTTTKIYEDLAVSVGQITGKPIDQRLTGQLCNTKINIEMEKNFIIDKITNSIESAKTHESYPTDVFPVSKDDIMNILKKDDWRFDWKLENKKKGRQLFKLVIRDNLVIQRLVSVEMIENFVEIHLIEVAPHNYWRKKKYQEVSGNLVAFACKMSFEYGFEGAVAFTAKTCLIQH